MSATWTFADVVAQITALQAGSGGSPVGFIATLQAASGLLPTTLPASPGVLWLDGGTFSIS